jgi:hypothetical protein
LVRDTNAAAPLGLSDSFNQNYNMQRFAPASAPASDTGASLFGVSSNKAGEARGSAMNPRYMTSYSHMSMLCVGRAGAPQMR